jgi:hypothetical protein
MTDDGTIRIADGSILGTLTWESLLQPYPRRRANPVGSGCHQPASGYDPLGLRCFELRWLLRLSELRAFVTPEPSRKAGADETFGTKIPPLSS